MSSESPSMPPDSAEDQRWAADKRSFVADWRDSAADDRDIVADSRERTADKREAELDAWEQRLEQRIAELGLTVDSIPESIGRRQERVQTGKDRLRERHDREGVSQDRHEVTKRRLTDGRPALLALVFADIAEQLYRTGSFDDVLQRIAEAAVATVAGCSVASVTLRQGEGYRTAASTGPAASAADQAQYLVDEGPSLDALTIPLVSAPAFPDARWPNLATRPTQAGVQSAVSYRLPASTDEGEQDSMGSLNAYGLTPESFDDTAQAVGFILAAHASLAARAVGERSTLEGLGRQLQDALFSRDVIGQAKGILMERLRITPEDAFDILRRSSQRLNVKLREIARSLTETGEAPRLDN